MFGISQNNNQNSAISWQNVFKFYAVLILLLTIWYFRQIILFALVAFVVASLLEPPINFFWKKIKNRWASTLIVYSLGLFLLGIVIYFAVPVLSSAAFELFLDSPFGLELESLPKFFEQWPMAEIYFDKGIFSLENIGAQLINLIVQSFDFLVKIAGGAFSIFFILILSFFLNTEKDGMERGIRLIFPRDYEEYAVYLWGKAKKKVNGWFFSQLIVSLMVGSLVFLSFKTLGVSQAGFLGILSGLLDFVPYLGPFIAGIIIALIVFDQSLFLGIMAVSVFVIIQLIEGIISPLIRSRAMKLNPVIIIFALLIGGKLAGTMGIIIALPLAAILMELIKDIRSGQINEYLSQKKLGL